MTTAEVWQLTTEFYTLRYVTVELINCDYDVIFIIIEVEICVLFFHYTHVVRMFMLELCNISVYLLLLHGAKCLSAVSRDATMVF